ncbi:DUF115 domain-containing protein [Lysinibacillus sp. CNPSo 3705]|uniref:6-hydroxymethylpterin diphosphokinase MptE-like protein n=1 Tax=Lysinibacillus sp. CNPSo 3705 TaxID=3028148 RepID=UPI002363F388|nr:6-hydroxymethylpterin diphosphokinase MptE-like protein [Lysinibacillus sp. CNPSo 3705]MDD1503987.1 DUF115 domain-containing protein [Lysinibacillus sp. CNPSo 3705]
MSKIQVEILDSKIGVPALRMEVDDKKLMLHSKYNPIQEAERFIDSLKERIEDSEHILFYGVGLGYHISYFCELYPEKLASAYEPITEIANLCLKLKSKTAFPKEKLAHFLIEDTENSLQANIQRLRELVHQKFIIITLPVYERLFSVKTENFSQSFRDFLLMVGNDIVTTAEFSRRWTVNALMNLPHTLKDPNFLLHQKHFFKGKPAIIVSAGPSLDEELENLRYIKENGLAYIFAVGSSNKTLLKHNIYPDAVVTYDPQQHNYKLFEEIYSRGINSIPMIYGTTVGYETLDYYTGPKMYFVTSQDKITQQFHQDKLPIIYDAPSVALIAMQLLNALEVSEIILVGQNFAFKKDKFYADGITRYDEDKRAISDNSIQEKDVAISLETEDVHGGKVKTSSHFLQMKVDMELYLQYVNMPVINTTSGGAAIIGTEYQPLKQLIEKKLVTSIVNDDWLDKSTSKSLTKVNKVFMNEFQREFDSFVQHDKLLKVYLIEFNEKLHGLKPNQIQKKLEHLDELFNQYFQNVFFQTSIIQIAKRSIEKLKAETQLVYAMSTSREKAEKVIKMHMAFLEKCRLIYSDIAPIISNWTIPKVSEMVKSKSFIATSGVFHYEGEWQRKIPISREEMPEGLTEEELEIWYKEKDIKDAIELPISFVETFRKGSLIQFRFMGNKLSIYGSNHSKVVLDLKVIIDNKITNLSINSIENVIDDLYIRKEIKTFTNLNDEIHNVTIEVLSESPNFTFHGIEINKSGRSFHIHEVERIEDLTVGKRIRCHYEAFKNNVGHFSGWGKEESPFLEIIPRANPYGDFYFICVEDGKLIADRNVQNEISWLTLETNDIATISGYQDKKLGIIVTLPTGGKFRDDQENDWFKYIKNSFKNNLGITNSDFYWNCVSDFTSWCLDESTEYKGKVVIRGRYRNLNKWKGKDGHYWGVSDSKANEYTTNSFRPIVLY